MAIYVAERILQLLEVEGIKTLFGIPDPSFFRMFPTAVARGWRVIAPHHEEAGAFMAEAMWRMTGIPGVVVGNQGPGVANLLPAAVNAAKENAPVIFIGGQRKQIAAQRVRRGRIQYTHQWRPFESSMKFVGIIADPDQTDEIIHEAFRRALSGTPGPVYIEVPMNTMYAQADFAPAPPPDTYRLMHLLASADAIDAAVALINKARVPILLAGNGAFTSRAHDSIAALAKTLECPVIHTYPVSSFPAGIEERTFPCGFEPAGRESLSGSDLVIAIGTELGETVHDGLRGSWAKGNVDRKWIHVERDTLAFNVNRHIDVPLVGDLRDVLPQLLRALKGTQRKRPPELDTWIKMHADYRAQCISSAPTTSTPIHPARLIVEATGAVPKDAVLVRDGAAVSVFTWTYSQWKPRDSVWNQNFGHLGTGLPYAIGAQLAAEQGRRVVLITGDSAFLFHISELETAVRKGLPIVCIVGCDFSWGVEVAGYRSVLGPNSPETEAHWGKQTRFDKVAEAFGGHGEYVERAEEIAPAVKRALASGKPAVVHVTIDADANCSQLPGHSEYHTWYRDFF